MSEIIILDIKIIISHIRNYADQAFYLRYPKHILDIKKNFQISKNKHLFRISKIVILGYLEFFFRYPKLMCQYFGYPEYSVS